MTDDFSVEDERDDTKREALTPETREVARLNDELRKYGRRGDIVATRSVAESPYRDRIVEAIKTYEFHGIDGNNPYGENDFGAVTVEGEKFYFKLDYYDLALQHHSPDKANPAVTRRVLTILKAEEY